MSNQQPWSSEALPALPLSEWRATKETLHRYTQVVGKIRLALQPKVNHWWHVTLYVSSRGLTTRPIPYGARSFELAFDFIDHQFMLTSSDGRSAISPAGWAIGRRFLPPTLRWPCSA